MSSLETQSESVLNTENERSEHARDESWETVDELQYYVEKSDYESDKRVLERQIGDLEVNIRQLERQVESLEQQLRQALTEVHGLKAKSGIEYGQVKYGRE